MMNPCNALEKRILQQIQEKEMLSIGDRVLVALSGGADSVALLHIILALCDKLHISVEAAHFEHGIRGEQSQQDALFVEAMCKSLNVPVHIGHGHVPSLAVQWKKSLEDAARQARYAFLHRTALLVKANKIALAHQLQDQAETLLLHLVHGCGLNGLVGMRSVQGVCIRPLLDISRDNLEAYLREKHIVWHEDETNKDIRYTRNLLRHNVFPVLQSVNPRVCEAMARTALQVAKTVAQLEAQSRALLRGRVKRMHYGAFWFTRGIEYTIDACRMFAEWAGVPALDSAQSEALFALESSQQCNLPAGWHAFRAKDRLHLLSPVPCMPIPVLEGAFQWEDCVRYMHRDAARGVLGDGVHTQVFDADMLDGAVFRYRRDGDVFSPLGANGTQKLKKTLQDAGIDRPFRDLLPLLTQGSRVLWIVGLKPSQEAAVTDQTTRSVRITYHSRLPWEL